LPGTLRITEVDFHIRGHRKVLVFRHLQSPVPGQRASQGSGKFTNVFTQCAHNLRRISAGYLDQQDKARMAFHQGRDVTKGIAVEVSSNLTQVTSGPHYAVLEFQVYRKY
jgi:hypothetical protein